MNVLQRTYVAAVRRARALARNTGAIGVLERRRKSRLALWTRSLFAIHDIDDLTRLDLPWWTFDAIERVEEFLHARPEARIFEFGSGASTIWLARRGGQVFSVEHDAQWSPIVAARLRDHQNVRLMVVPPDETPSPDPRLHSTKPAWRGRSFGRYVQAIDQVDGLFDLIVIDGRVRPACLDRAAARLKPDGLIVFDNSHRRAYRRAIGRSGLVWKRYRGLAACLPYPDETTLLTRP